MVGDDFGIERKFFLPRNRVLFFPMIFTRGPSRPWVLSVIRAAAMPPISRNRSTEFYGNKID
jgi:hypothetical protein